MSSVVAMMILFGVLAVALLAWFAVAWTKEKSRSDEESVDTARLPADTHGRGHGSAANGP